jgi:hypothetical protein
MRRSNAVISPFRVIESMEIRGSRSLHFWRRYLSEDIPLSLIEVQKNQEVIKGYWGV